MPDEDLKSEIKLSDGQVQAFRSGMPTSINACNPGPVPTVNDDVFLTFLRDARLPDIFASALREYGYESLEDLCNPSLVSEEDLMSPEIGMTTDEVRRFFVRARRKEQGADPGVALDQTTLSTASAARPVQLQLPPKPMKAPPLPPALSHAAPNSVAAATPSAVDLGPYPRLSSIVPLLPPKPTKPPPPNRSMSSPEIVASILGTRALAQTDTNRSIEDCAKETPDWACDTLGIETTGQKKASNEGVSLEDVWPTERELASGREEFPSDPTAAEDKPGTPITHEIDVLNANKKEEGYLPPENTKRAGEETYSEALHGGTTGANTDTSGPKARLGSMRHIRKVFAKTTGLRGIVVKKKNSIDAVDTDVRNDESIMSLPPPQQREEQERQKKRYLMLLNGVARGELMPDEAVMELITTWETLRTTIVALEARVSALHSENSLLRHATSSAIQNGSIQEKIPSENASHASRPVSTVMEATLGKACVPNDKPTIGNDESDVAHWNTSENSSIAAIKATDEELDEIDSDDKTIDNADNNDNRKFANEGVDEDHLMKKKETEALDAPLDKGSAEVDPPLPPGWEALEVSRDASKEPNGETPSYYYHNVQTGETTWEKPTGNRGEKSSEHGVGAEEEVEAEAATTHALAEKGSHSKSKIRRPSFFKLSSTAKQTKRNERRRKADEAALKIANMEDKFRVALLHGTEIQRHQQQVLEEAERQREKQNQLLEQEELQQQPPQQRDAHKPQSPTRYTHQSKQIEHVTWKIEPAKIGASFLLDAMNDGSTLQTTSKARNRASLKGGKESITPRNDSDASGSSETAEPPRAPEGEPPNEALLAGTVTLQSMRLYWPSLPEPWERGLLVDDSTYPAKRYLYFYDVDSRR